MPTINIQYNETKNINEYLDRYGAEILYAMTAYDTTTSEAIDSMSEAYGKLPVSRWVRRHKQIQKLIKETKYYA